MIGFCVWLTGGNEKSGAGKTGGGGGGGGAKFRIGGIEGGKIGTSFIGIIEFVEYTASVVKNGGFSHLIRKLTNKKISLLSRQNGAQTRRILRKIS